MLPTEMLTCWELGYNKSAVEAKGQHSITHGEFGENMVTLVLIHATH